MPRPPWWKAGGKYNTEAYNKHTKTFYTAEQRRGNAQANRDYRDINFDENDWGIEDMPRHDRPGPSRDRSPVHQTRRSNVSERLRNTAGRQAVRAAARMAGVPEPVINGGEAVYDHWQDGQEQDNESNATSDAFDEMEQDEEQPNEIGVAGGRLAGGNSVAPSYAERTLQRWDALDGQGSWELRTFESSLWTVMKVTTSNTLGLAYTIPWESINVCHSMDELASALVGCDRWKPLSAHVSMTNTTNHAEIPVTQNAAWPIQLNNVRMKFADMKCPVLNPHVKIFDGLDDFTTWENLFDKGDTTGEVKMELPQTHVFKGDSRIFSNPEDLYIRMDDDLWKEKKMVDDKFLDFHFNVPDGPIRDVNEILTVDARQVDGQGNNKTRLTGFPRFDYMMGVLNMPIWNSYKWPGFNKTNAWAYRRQGPTPPGFIQLQESIDTKSYLPDGNFVDFDTTNPATKTKFPGMDFDEPSCMPYSHRKVMKPILLTPTLFMNNDQVSPFRVYSCINITHEIMVRKSRRCGRSYRMNDKRTAMKASNVALNNYQYMVGDPVDYSSDQGGARFMPNMFERLYRPIIYPFYTAVIDNSKK